MQRDMEATTNQQEGQGKSHLLIGSAKDVEPIERVQLTMEILKDQDCSSDNGGPGFETGNGLQDHDIPNFQAIASAMTPCFPDYIKPSMYIAFLRDTTIVLASTPVCGWKEIHSAFNTSSGSSTASSTTSRVTFLRIYNVMCEMLASNEKVPSRDNFRNDKAGFKKFFGKELLAVGPKGSSLTKKMNMFAAMYSGFISKIYYAKVGHHVGFEVMKKDLGSKIANEALKASGYSTLFDYRLVFPDDLFQKFGFVDGVAETTAKHDLLRSHAILENDEGSEMGPPALIPKLRSNPHREVEQGNPGSFHDKIMANNRRMYQCEQDIENLKKQIDDRKDEIDTLIAENQSFKKQQLQQSNNQSLVEKIRNIVPDDEAKFEQVTTFVCDVLPVVMPLISTVNMNVLKQCFEKITEEMVAAFPKGSEEGLREFSSGFAQDAENLADPEAVAGKSSADSSAESTMSYLTAAELHVSAEPPFEIAGIGGISVGSLETDNGNFHAGSIKNKRKLRARKSGNESTIKPGAPGEIGETDNFSGLESADDFEETLSKKTKR